MKKHLFVSAVIFAAVLSAVSFAAMPYAPKNVVAINLGPKNPTFNESKFQDIKFYYTPELNWDTNKAGGKPAFLADWINKKGLRQDEAVLLDRNGFGAFECFLMRDTKFEDNRILGDIENMGEALKAVVENGRTSGDRTGKKMDLTMISAVYGRPFPDFEIVTSSGEVTTTRNAISAAGLPTIVFVYYIPRDHQFKDAESSMKDVTTVMQAIGGITNMSVSDDRTDLLNRIENDLYCR
ncbi:MAG: hypothetical protein NTZ10_02230 [Candidatus Saganbacteria bacterium]|nr:hypothetical protein [Candidatus Saganbacteria bacterium]